MFKSFKNYLLESKEPLKFKYKDAVGNYTHIFVSNNNVYATGKNNVFVSLSSLMIHSDKNGNAQEKADHLKSELIKVYKKYDGDYDKVLATLENITNLDFSIVKSDVSNIKKFNLLLNGNDYTLEVFPTFIRAKNKIGAGVHLDLLMVNSGIKKDEMELSDILTKKTLEAGNDASKIQQVLSLLTKAKVTVKH